jgi:hypothetical protein
MPPPPPRPRRPSTHVPTLSAERATTSYEKVRIADESCKFSISPIPRTFSSISRFNKRQKEKPLLLSGRLLPPPPIPTREMSQFIQLRARKRAYTCGACAGLPWVRERGRGPCTRVPRGNPKSACPWWATTQVPPRRRSTHAASYRRVAAAEGASALSLPLSLSLSLSFSLSLSLTLTHTHTDTHTPSLPSYLSYPTNSNYQQLSIYPWLSFAPSHSLALSPAIPLAHP